MSLEVVKKFTPLFLSLFMAFYIVLGRVHSLNQKKDNIYQIQVGQSSLEVENLIGGPDDKQDGDWIYYFNRNSVLKLSFYKKKLSSAVMKYSKKPHFKEHHFPTNKFIRIEGKTNFFGSDSLVIAAPEKGLVWEISKKGTIQKVSWQGVFEDSQEKQSLETIIGKANVTKTTALIK